MKYNSPLTRELISGLKDELDRRGLPIVRMTELLNVFLEEDRQLRTHSDKIKLYAWMNTAHKDWFTPSGEVVLAMKKVLESLKNS